ncbi:hypothetical protein ACFV90_40765 [Streptomyces sp. NPDC059904]|uniref:hypothetical protein n=1 Tax=Streptomyces sp. NPDC059904 TaxID=3346996 RepID=UPI003662446A
MSVTVTKTAGHKAEITWGPNDDPKGYIARVIEAGHLEDTLTTLGATTIEGLGTTEDLKRIAYSTNQLAALLERRTRTIALVLRNEGLSWAELADALYGDPEKRGNARRAYEAGLRQAGISAPVTEEDDV